MPKAWSDWTPGTIYFLAAPDANLVKIGFTTGPVEKRIGDIQTMSPVPVILWATIAGNMTVERKIHGELADYRRHGEWFDMDAVEIFLEAADRAAA